MPSRHSWTSKLGFYLVAIGSACGLGNLWRFPYIVGENGGGAFVLLYFLLTMTVGLPLLIGELLLGKVSHKSVILATKELKFRNITSFKWAGRFAVLTSLIVFSYYAVISGWVLHFLMQFIFGSFAPNGLKADLVLNSLMNNGFLQIGLASVHILIVVVISNKGVQEGLEKWIGNMMPIFFLLLLLLMGKTLSLPASEEALRFLLYPDFSKLRWGSLISALGHVFFTLSIGFGTMVTFGSFLNAEDHVPSAGSRVAFADAAISILAGLLVFPIVLSAGSKSLTDPTLLFDSLPRFFSVIPGGYIFGIAFFICLYIAALGASMGLFEVIVSNINERFRKVSRIKASWLTAALTLAIAIVPALSSSLLSSVRINDKGLLEFLDGALISVVLPLIGLGMCLSIDFGLSDADKSNEFMAKDHLNSSALYKHWRWTLRWWIPGITILGFILFIFGAAV